MAKASQVATTRYKPRALRRFAAEIFQAAGSDADEADAIADHLVEANLVGHDSHGVVRVKKYVDWARQGLVLPNRHAEIVVDRSASLLLDGGFGYGQVIGR